MYGRWETARYMSLFYVATREIVVPTCDNLDMGSGEVHHAFDGDAHEVVGCSQGTGKSRDRFSLPPRV